MGIPRLHGPRSECNIGGDHLACGVAVIARIRTDLAPERADSYPTGRPPGKAAGHRRRAVCSGVARVAADRGPGRGVRTH